MEREGEDERVLVKGGKGQTKTKRHLIMYAFSCERQRLERL